MKLLRGLILAGACLLSLPTPAAAQANVNVEDRDSVISAVGYQSRKLLGRYYVGNQTGQTPGLLPDVYWWEAGAMFGALIDYWFYTGDEGNNAAITQALIHQSGEARNFEPKNHTSSLGNDDQAFWAIAALAAAEKKYPELPEDQGPGWLALVQRVFERQTARWEEEVCNGGMRWQAIQWNKGYDYKNTVSNGLYFQLGARLARFTGNHTYAKLAERTWDWMEDIGLLNVTGGHVFDGAWIPDCKKIDRVEWTYNNGIIGLGAAFMYNISEPGSAEAQKWADRLNLYFEHSKVFQRTDIPGLYYEPACEFQDPPSCNDDQRTFKGFYARFYSLAAQLAPFMQEKIEPVLRTAAKYAARSCVGGPTNDACGMRWWFEGGGVWDGYSSVGEELAVLETLQSVLAFMPLPNATEDGREGIKYITTKDQGGSSRSVDDEKEPEPEGDRPASTGDRAGAWILTVLLSAVPLGVSFWAIKGGTQW